MRLRRTKPEVAVSLPTPWAPSNWRNYRGPEKPGRISKRAAKLAMYPHRITRRHYGRKHSRQIR